MSCVLSGGTVLEGVTLGDIAGSLEDGVRLMMLRGVFMSEASAAKWPLSGLVSFFIFLNTCFSVKV